MDVRDILGIAYGSYANRLHSLAFFLKVIISCKTKGQTKGGIETRSVYFQYIQVIQPYVPARTLFIEIYSLFWSMYGTCMFHV